MMFEGINQYITAKQPLLENISSTTLTVSHKPIILILNLKQLITLPTDSQQLIDVIELIND